MAPNEMAETRPQTMPRRRKIGSLSDLICHVSTVKPSLDDTVPWSSLVYRVGKCKLNQGTSSGGFKKMPVGGDNLQKLSELRWLSHDRNFLGNETSAKKRWKIKMNLGNHRLWVPSLETVYLVPSSAGGLQRKPTPRMAAEALANSGPCHASCREAFNRMG